MEKDKKLEFTVLSTALAIISFALTANYLSVLWGGYPFLYCGLRPYAVPVYVAVGTLCLYASAIYAIWHTFVFNPMKMIGGIAFFVAVVELPSLADYAIRLGGHCT